MDTFRDFEHSRWEDSGVCSAYSDRLGALVVQVIGPLLDGVGLGPSDSVLDVATGNGLVAAAAAAQGATVVGVDFSGEQLRRARAENPTLRFEQGDADALPFGDEDFDVAVSNFGMPHFPDPDGYLRESLRVLRPAGRLGFTVWDVPARAKGFGAVLDAVGKYGSMDVGLPKGPNLFLYADPDAARERLLAAGFEDVSITTVEQTWKLQAADDAFLSIRDGTARTAALLKRQTPEALTRIQAAVAKAMTAYQIDGAYLVPMPAVLVTATKPT